MLFPVLAGAEEEVNSDNLSTWVIHEVEPDNTLSKLGERYDVSVNSLRENNSLNSDSLFEGQNLLIKETDVTASYFLHDVKKGDTPYLLSERYQVSLDKLMEINNFNESSVLYVGDQIRIPLNLFVYSVESGDTPWKISNRFSLSLDDFMEINNLTESSVIYEGQKLLVPQNSAVKDENVESGEENSGEGTEEYWVYTVEQGDTLWKISQRYDDVTLAQLLNLNELTKESVLIVGQEVKIPGDSPEEQSKDQLENLEPTTTYEKHTVSSGETAWTISIDYGIPMDELLEVNNMTENEPLSPGQELTIPVHHVPVHPTVSSNHGELLDWWTEAQYLWPINERATIIDFDTGKSWQVQRSYGAAHADVEPLTSKDASIMREVWGGWSWKTRPVLVVYEGRKIAASATAMPHSIQKIDDNNFDGHSDIHFLNSRTHNDYTVNEAHQRAVYIAAGQSSE